MRRAASLTASKEEMQLFWTVRDWHFSGRPLVKATTRAMLGAEKVCPTQPTMRPSTAAASRRARSRRLCTAACMSAAGGRSARLREMWPMGVRRPAQRTIRLASAFMRSL
jgi:hypothetical protein